MTIESIIEVADVYADESLDTIRQTLDPYIYNYLIAKYSVPLEAFWSSYLPPIKSKYAYVIVERRCHPNFKFILQNMAWANPEMSVYIFCSLENIQFILSILGDKQKNYNICEYFTTTATREEGKEEYNKLLTSSKFYDVIDAEYLLTMQMDVIIRKKIPESIFCGDYWGAPWAWKSNLPGGGGATIRKISTMRIICKESSDGKHAEDAWICDAICKDVSYTFPSLEFRANHIMESIPVNDPILLHQFWTFYNQYLEMNKESRCNYWSHLLTINI